MPYSKVKVYSDGNHYICIPYEPNPRAKNRRPRKEEIIDVKESIEQETQGVSDTENITLSMQNQDDICEKNAPSAVRQMTRKELFDELYLKSQE